MKKFLAFCCAMTLFISCKKDGDIPGPGPDGTIYFPPIGGSVWEGASPASLGWNTTALANTINFLQQKNT
ncbi:MAG TPA: hypothetical protein VK907_09455, partial [Phnomibacter sp.]|nr:hypothetical protein [Phnomibacter sp.]